MSVATWSRSVANELMKIPTRSSLALLIIAAISCSIAAADPTTQPSLLDRPDVFPIAVWLQSPANAARYKQIGINLYVGLWRGPTADQLSELEKAGMPLICSQNAEALKPRWRSEVLGFLQNDEPDNAQFLGRGKGYGPPVPPEKVLDRYRAMKAADPRPVLLNLGQGVAWDNWYGRGVRKNKPEDYPLYVQAADIISFDIYPAVHDNPEIAGHLWYVARGVHRLVDWTGGADHHKPVWTCIECTHISNPKVKPTPHQVRAEVWMAITHGARGITWFAHQFQPNFIEAGLLADPEMSAAVKTINAQIQSLAPAINAPPPNPDQLATVTATPDADAPADHPPIALMTRTHNGTTHVFAVAMTDQKISARFHLPTARGDVTVLDEHRTLPVSDNTWTDTFEGYDVHLYSLARGRAPP
jgi:hypothetical protein